MPKVVVTGSSGFLGGHVCAFLLKSKFDVIPISRTTHGPRAYLNLPKADFAIHLAEVADKAKVNLLGDEYKVAVLDTLEKISTDFSGRVIYASSSSVYCTNNIGNNNEDSSVDDGVFYNKLKLAGEEIVLKNDGVVLRFSNLFGSGMSPNNVISDVLKQLDSDTIMVRNGFPICDFLYIDDAVKVFQYLLYNRTPSIYNVGSSFGISIYDLSTLILKILGYYDRQVVSYVKDYQYSRNVLDTSKLEKATGWSPSVDVFSRLNFFLHNKLSVTK